MQQNEQLQVRAQIAESLIKAAQYFWPEGYEIPTIYPDVESYKDQEDFRQYMEQALLLNETMAGTEERYFVNEQSLWQFRALMRLR